MFHSPDSKSTFFQLLLKIDLDTMEALQFKGCPHCQGPLDRADYDRKPRCGPEEIPDNFSKMFSLCCRSDGCRRRVSPASVRFLGRKTYLLFFILMASSHSERLLSKLSRDLKVSRNTLSRWRNYWREDFPLSPVWKRLRGLISPSPSVEKLPVSLVASMRANPSEPESLPPVLKLFASL